MNNLQDEIKAILHKQKNNQYNSDFIINSQIATEKLLQLFDKSVKRAKPKKEDIWKLKQSVSYRNSDQPHIDEGWNQAIEAFEDNWNKIKSGEEKV